MPAKTRCQILREEVANCITHGVGAVLSVIGLVWLAMLSATYGTAWHMVGCAVFGTTLVLVYLASTLYHGFQSPRAKSLLLLLDHCAIYLLIAGSYTPFMLVTLRGPWGWSLLAVVWGLAVTGIALRLSRLAEWESPRIGLYVVMGWAALVAARPILATVPLDGLVLVVGGGVLYTVGIAFFLWRSLPFNHTVWHLFVLGGSALHYLAVLWYVIPSSSGA